MNVFVRTESTRTVLEVGPAEVYLSPRNTEHLIKLLQVALAQTQRVAAHNQNLARGAASPWPAYQLRDLQHLDIEAAVHSDQAPSWKEG